MKKTGIILGCLFLILGSCTGTSNEGRIKRASGSPVTLTGVIENINSSENAAGRSISSAITTIGSFSVIMGNLTSLDDVVTAEVEDDGSFELEVLPDDENEEIEYLLVAFNPDNGVGVEQLSGFIEIPVEADESSSAAWPLDDSIYTDIELGNLAADSDSLVADDFASQIYEDLNIDQQELLFKASRDNFLKNSQNEYFNQDSVFDIGLYHFVKGDLTPAENGWTTIEDINHPEMYEYYIQIWLTEDSYFTVDDITNGSNVVTITPPAEILSRDYATFDTETPLDLNSDFEFSGDHYFAAIFGPPPSGAWIFNIDGEDEYAYDLEFSSPYDEDFHYLYFIPSINITVDESTSLITGIQLRFYTWDTVGNEYVWLDDVSNELPFAGEFGLELACFEEDSPSGEDTWYELEAVANTEIEPPVEIYMNKTNGKYSLSWVSVTYSLGSGYGFEFLNPFFYERHNKRPE
ncbi:MAG: hypothetical protein JEY99_19300 [Spirochaetales bacterium]|nr:hypothetical protein [Spirochaetales bacterium]